MSHKIISNPQLPILVVDDEKDWLECFSFMLKYEEGLDNVITCQNSRDVMDIVNGRELSLILLDLTMPPPTGEELLAQLSMEHPETPIIVITALDQVNTAVHCIKQGASDFFVKTEDRARILTSIKRILANGELRQENHELKTRILGKNLEHPGVFSGIITQNQKMFSLFSYLEAISASSEPVLVTGESGSGKELIAKAVHRLSRPDGPWVAVNAPGLDDAVFSDTLFGHVRGAFTGADKPRPGLLEQAEEGILFLDEIGDLSLAAQVKLLRLLQEGEYYPLGADRPRKINMRMVFATNQDLEAKQENGKFRRDLYYRLLAHEVRLPPLRERPEDIGPLLEYFVVDAAHAMQKRVPEFTEDLIVFLKGYDFPGNVRELRAMVYDALSQARGRLEPGHFRRIRERKKEFFAKDQGCDAPQFPSSLDSLDRLPTLKKAGDDLVLEALRRSNGSQKFAADVLGITPSALNKRLKKMFPSS